MILDAIIALFVSLFGTIAAGVSFVFVPLINLLAACIEAVVRIFVSGFSLGRIERKERKSKSRASTVGSVLTLIIIAGLIGWLLVGPKLMNRTVTLLAEDGHSLPFAALIVHTDGGDRHKRTDNAGNIVIPRFRTNALTIKDPRYVEQTWQKPEIEPELIVGRTAFGSSLDSIADRFLKP